jgi:hypothetical protein
MDKKNLAYSLEQLYLKDMSITDRRVLDEATKIQ